MGWFGSDKHDDKDDKGTGGDSPGPMGGHESYGMDKESFDHSIGKGNDKGGSDTDSKSFIDNVTDWAGDTVGDVKGWFSGEEDTGGFSPMGGPTSYGMSTQTFDETIGERRHKARSLDQRLVREIDYFQEAPLDYAADFLDNPLVSLATAASGLGMTAFGIKAVDAVADYFQAEASPIATVKSLAGNIVESTPVGAPLGPMRQIVAAGIQDVDTVAPNIAGKAGTMAGGQIASKVASAVTDNPYAHAALSVGGAVGAGAYAKKAVADAQEASKGATGIQTTSTPSPREPRGRDESPLVSSGSRAVASSKRLMQPAQSDLYAQTVKQLPFYGLGNQQLPYFGV